MKTECDYLYGRIKKTVTYAKNLTQNGEHQRFSGNAEEVSGMT